MRKVSDPSLKGTGTHAEMTSAVDVGRPAAISKIEEDPLTNGTVEASEENSNVLATAELQSTLENLRGVGEGLTNQE